MFHTPPTSSDTSIEGAVERVTFFNPQNGYSVVKLRVRGRREPVAVVGTLPAVQPGETLLVSGCWQIDPRHGAQFRADSASTSPPTTCDSIVRYLGSGLIRQLGPVLAERIVKTFGDKALEVLDTRPERVREVPGIGPQRAQAVAAAWAEHRALRAVSAFLVEHKLDARYAPRLVAAYGPDAPKVLSANPYRLVADVPGLGFGAADHLGQDLEIRPTAPARLQAAVHAATMQAAEHGHTRVSRDDLSEQAAELAGVPPELVDAAIAQLLSSGVLAKDTAPAPPPRTLTLTLSQREREKESASPSGGSPNLFVESPFGLSGGRPSGERAGEGDASPKVGRGRRSEAEPGEGGQRLRIFEPEAPQSMPESGSDLGLSGLVKAEEYLAGRLQELARRPVRRSPPAVDAWLAADRAARELSAEQRAAVRTAVLSPCFVLSGGPGVGKTTAVRALVRCLHALGLSVALAAPTGKAAKRLGEVTGVEAQTVHRLLGAGPKRFRFGAREPLPFDIVIVDEASMLDTQLARAVLAAIGDQGQLVLVGDADQLPSVGPGQVLRDLLASRIVPSVRLETVFRQAAESQIVRNAHRIRQGLTPVLEPASALAQGADCVFVPASANQIASLATHWAVDRLPRLGGLDRSEIQVLAPLVRVCQSLNGSLQTQLNPPRGQAERPHGALPLRTGDRVIQTHNNYNLGVFNGDTGTVAAIEPDSVGVDFGDGRLIVYTPSDLVDLDHAYCLTVHRAQGSEWPGVIVLASSSYGPMLTRNLLYTALTRARKAAVIIGDEAAIARAVAETRDQERRTGLALLLNKGRNTLAR